MKFITLTIVATLTMGFASSSVNSAKWSATGHRVTGAIAERHLSGKARAAVKEILGNETLAEATTWADEMRSSPVKYWGTTAYPYHYVTVPKGKTYEAVGAPEEGDAVFAIEMFTAQLLDPESSLQQKQEALRFIVHAIGDLHQPLHSGNGTDRGGNDIKVKYFGKDTNLHSVWDRQMIASLELSYSEFTEFLDAKITPEQVKMWSEPNPKVWVAESIALRDTIYPEKTNLGYDYKFIHTPTVKKRLSMGGIRMATYLNKVFE